MKKTMFAFMHVLSFSLSYAGPKCMSGAQLPFQEVFSEKSGLGKALEASMKIDSPINVEQIKWVCRAICSDNKQAFYDQVEVLMSGFKGTREEKIKKFYSDYFYETRCDSDSITIGVKTCENNGENFLRTSFEDFVDLTAEHMILNYNIDLNKKDSVDNMSTIEWLHSKCIEPDLLVKDYFCKKEKQYACTAFKQLPKTEQKNPPKGCQI